MGSRERTGLEIGGYPRPTAPHIYNGFSTVEPERECATGKDDRIEGGVHSVGHRNPLHENGELKRNGKIL